MAEPDCEKYESDEARWSALMVSAQAGNEAEYRLLLEELSEVIRRYLLSRIGAHNFIEDCVQESLIAIHQARHTYDRRRRFRPWMFAIVRHKAIDALRRQRSHRQVLAGQREDALLGWRQGQPAGPEESAAQGQMMSSLAPPYREALTLTKIIGLTNAEAAARLCISESAVKVRVHRAIGRLRRLLEADAR